MTQHDAFFGPPSQGGLTRRQLLRRGAALGVAASAAAGLLAACSQPQPTPPSQPQPTSPSKPAAGSAATSAPAAAAQAKDGGTLTFGAWQTPDTMDPQKTGLAATSRIL